MKTPYLETSRSPAAANSLHLREVLSNLSAYMDKIGTKLPFLLHSHPWAALSAAPRDAESGLDSIDIATKNSNYSIKNALISRCATCRYYSLRRRRHPKSLSMTTHWNELALDNCFNQGGEEGFHDPYSKILSCHLLELVNHSYSPTSPCTLYYRLG